MARKLNLDKINQLPTFDQTLEKKYGPKGSVQRNEFEAKARSWYYCEVLKNARKEANITQKQLAEMIGKKREYIAILEKGETDMQLSTFLMISEAIGLKFGFILP